ncbi:MAG: hypothetical protein JJ858_15720 [Rhizobiaceae bacterium]|nr:hypothetical protein [Rhizobiaceae bacterium]
MAEVRKMMGAISVIGQTVRTSWRRLIAWGVVVSVLFQIIMLIALIVRFQAVPNYITFYDWIGNVSWIIQSTPSWRDMLPIISEEWLIEIGKMNYDYGTGISEWSLNVVPSKVLVMFFLGSLIGLSSMLMRSDECSVGSKRGLALGTGVGGILIAMTNATMSWVVCCATPSWVVGLAMLGLGVSTSLALETMGPALSGTGLLVLLTVIFILAWRKSNKQQYLSAGVKYA